MSKKTLAIDFDGVIHKYSKGWQEGEIYDEPVDGAIEALAKLAKDYKIVIFSTRANEKHLAQYQGLKGSLAITSWIYDHMTEETGVFDFDVTGEKPAAIAYIDDRAVRFTNWEDIRKMFQ